MITVNFPDLNQFLSFDGAVLEVFYGDASKRIHIGHIQSIQVTADHKENRTLHIKTLVGEGQRVRRGSAKDNGSVQV